MRTPQRMCTLRRVFAITLLVTGLAAGPAHALRPVVFVHGSSGSGAQYESQAMRFASNGYPASYVRAQCDQASLNPRPQIRGARRSSTSLRADGRRPVDLPAIRSAPR
jgi:triacylglycerol esterase/lipase EstA (alpha/beta hydrolase family)